MASIAHAMFWSKLNELVLPFGIIGCLLVFLVPLPGTLLDVLLSANIALGLVVLLTTIYVRTPLEFSVFPTVLLATTLARLVLNVATTRLILTKADTAGLSAAGEVIRQFGQFVSGDRPLVGLVIFAIIFVIQMLVITKGATRISEVAARFALDGTPGKQLAIDADLSAGAIDQQEAQQRRERLNDQADFYGAMDGASKFVRGDAIAGAIITVINMLGGLFIGVFQGSMPLWEAANTYTKLTIGDGLVSQIPALLISLAAGLLVTRGSQSANLPREMLRQLLSRPQVLAISGGFLALLVFTQLPTLPLLLLAGGCGGLAWVARGRLHETPPAAPSKAPRAARSRAVDNESRIEDFLQVDAVEIELGLALLRLANQERGGDLLPRITKVRQRVASDLGLVLPRVRMRDNLRLSDHQYVIKISGNAVAQAQLPADGVVVEPRDSAPFLSTVVRFSHPAVAKEARLVPIDRIHEAQSAGCRIVSSTALIADHLHRVVQELAHELLTRDATWRLVQEVKKTCPAVVEELIPDVLKLNEVQHVLQGLLREGIPIRQLPLILETLGDHASQTRDTAALTELVRRRLARTISARYQDEKGRLHVVTLDPHLEQQLASAGRQPHDALTPPEASTFQAIVKRSLARLTSENRPPILLTRSELRVAVLTLARTAVPQVVVLGQDEVAPESRVCSVGIVGLT